MSDFPTAQSIKKPDEDVSSKDDVVENVVSEPSPVVQPTVPKEAELDLALEKISSLEKLVAEKDSALEAQKSKLEMQADTNASTSELQTKIDELEKKLAAFEKQSPVETVEDKKPEPVSIKKASDVALTKAVEKPVKTVSSQWILKGANSNKAILSDKRTGDLKTISIGQTVPGLGRILSISESGSGWSVKGTLATVTE